ncbi:xylose isomerase-like protein, partial [Ochromonadaceae sp. CCMP2298]
MYQESLISNTATTAQLPGMSGESCLLVAKSLWGVVEAGDPSRWDRLFAQLKEEGYRAVETICVFDLNLNPVLFRQLLDKHSLQLIIQLHTASDWGKYDYCTSCDVDEHVASFRSLVQEALQHGPTIINVHSGHDSWSVATAVDYFSRVLEVEAELLGAHTSHSHVTLVHETHRQRLLGNPYQCRDILKDPRLSKLKVNCDLSHWVCACEHIFDAQRYPQRDQWWSDVLALVASHCHLIHARFGHEQGPQVVDIGASGSSDSVHAHLQWWGEIWQAQRVRGGAHWVVTEHGPEPYQIWGAKETQRG